MAFPSPPTGPGLCYSTSYAVSPVCREHRVGENSAEFHLKLALALGIQRAWMSVAIDGAEAIENGVLPLLSTQRVNAGRRLECFLYR